MQPFTWLGALTLTAAAASADTIVVQQVGLTFEPADITIQVGDTVMWMWNSGFHTVTEGTDGSVDGDEAFHQQLNSSEPTYSVTFDAAFLAANPPVGGVFDYFCAPHFFVGQVGTITVESGPETYCTAKASSVGCLAAIAASSASQPVSGAGGYSVDATGVHSFKNGLVFVGISGPASIPFGGGTLCVTPPTKRGPLVNSGGSAVNVCDGTYSTVVNDGVIVPAGLDAGSGNSAWYQYWYRDPANGAGSLGTALSDGIRLDFQ